MAKNTNKITATGQAIVGAGRLLGILVCSHSSGTLQLNDQPQAGNLGRLVLDTYSFPTGSSYVPMGGIEYYDGLYATCGGTLSLELVTTPDMGGVIN